jgi:hypothetical protein
VIQSSDHSPPFQASPPIQEANEVVQGEENQEIQEMIIQFYSKFDQLHEQSVAKTLAKSPNKS